MLLKFKKTLSYKYPTIYRLLVRLKHKIVNKKVKIKDINEIYNNLELFELKKISILWDGNVDISDFLESSEQYDFFIFSMNLDVLEKEYYGYNVASIDDDNLNNNLVDGWLVFSQSYLYSYSLAKLLYDNELSSQIILEGMRHTGSTKYYSYVDYFSGQQNTVVHINNYYHRLYNIYYPLPVHLTLRDLNGTIHKKIQKIIPPNGICVVDSNSLLTDEFTGYLELEYEINSITMPFLHYMVDYISELSLSSNHQSGLGVFPPNTKFIRGFLPPENDRTLEVCFFQNRYTDPIDIKIILLYSVAGEPLSEIKMASGIKMNSMVYFDIKKLFSEIDFQVVENARIEIESKYPIHRPNFYYKKYGQLGYYDTSHSASTPLYKMTEGAWGGLTSHKQDEILSLQHYEYVPFDIKLLLFPNVYNLDTYLLVSDETTEYFNMVSLSVFLENGEHISIGELEVNYDSNGWVNLSSYIRKSLDISSCHVGSISIRLSGQKTKIPIFSSGIGAYKNITDNNYTSTACQPSSVRNAPFYYRGSAGEGKNYLLEETSVPVTDVFCRAISNFDYDTLIAINYSSPSCSNKESVEYHFEIINEFGDKHITRMSIRENGTDYIKVSEILKKTDIMTDSGYFTVWILCVSIDLAVNHLLIRKSDMSVSLEHAYVGKYGM